MTFRHAYVSFVSFSLLLGATATADQWSVNGSLQYTKGAYASNDEGEAYQLNTGVRFQFGRWNVAAGIPVVLQKSGASEGTLTTSGGMMSQGSMSSTSMMSLGLGDLYLNGAYELFEDSGDLPAIALTAQVKSPTASQGFGTGEFDYEMGLALRKALHTFVVFADVGYLTIGDPEGWVYQNPVTYGLGLGKFFNDGLYSVLFYYQGSGQIIPGIAGVNQGSLGFNYRLSPSTIVSFIAMRGFSDVSPTFSAAGGFQLAFD